MQKNILLILFLSFASTICAQQEKQFTLEELIPGGKHFYDFYPRLTAQYQWSGDNLIQVEKIRCGQPILRKKTRKESFSYPYRPFKTS